MRKLALLSFITLDGVMQGPSSPDEDRSGGFDNGGWARDCWNEVMQQVWRDAMSSPYDLVLGRNTYDSFSANFNQVDEEDPVANRLNNAIKYVITSNQDSLEWQNSQLLNGDVVQEILALKNSDGPLLQVHGSWQLIQTLLSNDLVDEIRLWTFPVVVGVGKRLFDSKNDLIKFELIKSDHCNCGAVMNFYHRC